MENIHQEAFVSGALSHLTGAPLFCKQMFVLSLHVSASLVWRTAAVFCESDFLSVCIGNRQHCRGASIDCWEADGCEIVCVLSFMQLMLHIICIGEKPEVTEAEAIKNAVASNMEQLDEAFLVALGAYISAAEEQGDAALAGTPTTGNITAIFRTA